jgi:hypothetical protein
MKWEGFWSMRNADTVLVQTSHGKRTFRRPRQRWIVNVKTDMRVCSGFK